MSMKIEGFDKLNAVLDALAKGDFDSALDGGSDIALKETQRLTPVLTGELRSSEHIEKPAKNVREIVADAPHAIFVEMGTSRMAAQPFMRPSIYGKANKIVNSINTGIQNIIKRMVR